jgi:hypothetical protein
MSTAERSDHNACEHSVASMHTTTRNLPTSIQVGWGGLADGCTEGQGQSRGIPTPMNHQSSGPSRRTQFVFAAFAVAMTAAMAILALDTPRQAGGFPLTSITPLEDRPSVGDDLLFATKDGLKHARWTGIVIHHLGDPFGTPESIHRQHLSWGYQGLGYHFLVGNGNGLANGEIHVGYRWIEQLPGAHVIGEAGRDHNEHSIGICLVGNGDRHGFADRQLKHLTRLVQRLQQEFSIPSDNVYLHQDLAAELTSPGRLFPEAEFRSQLLDAPR